MAIQILDNVDTTWLDQILLDRNGLVRPVKWKKLRQVPHNDIKVWCVRNGVYQIPTIELIEWLRAAIDGRKAIEICAGRSCLGRPLGIPMSDSHMHSDPSMDFMYRVCGQTPTIPPDDVERLNSNEAVTKYKPQVVIAAWATQLGDMMDGQSNLSGTDEQAILDTGAIYIHIGNAESHGKKRILQRPHLEYSFPWLTGRGLDRSLNRIWVWNAKERS